MGSTILLLTNALLLNIAILIFGWRRYAARAVRANPLHLRAWMRLLIGR